MCHPCSSDEWVCASQNLAPNLILVWFQITSVVLSQESGGRILPCPTRAAFIVSFCVYVCAHQMNNFYKNTPPVLPQFPWPLREILLDEEQNNPELVSPHFVVCRLFKEGGGRAEKRSNLLFSDVRPPREEAGVTFLAQDASPTVLQGKALKRC